MSHSFNTVREPTMDEILVSIREIIEENCAQDEAIEYVQAANNNAQRRMNTREVSVFEEGQAALKKSREEGKRDSVKDVNEEGKALSVNDAMRVLARRIGLDDHANMEQGTMVEAELKEESYSPKELIGDLFDTEAISSYMNKEVVMAHLSDTTERVLRPIIVQWLDRNLPQIMDKLLAEELHRAVQKPFEGS